MIALRRASEADFLILHRMQTVRAVEALYPDARRWELDTIAEEAKLCHLYEKMGYRRTGAYTKIHAGMHIVEYVKSLDIR